MRTKSFKSDHQVEILVELNKERKLPQNTCDVTLTSGSQDFAAHKCILFAFSKFFKKLFTCEMIEKYENKAEVKSIDGKTLGIILDFIYLCNIEISSENVCSLLEAANFLDIKNLRNYCAEFLVEEVDSDNCLSMHSYAKLYSIDELSQKVDATIKENFDAVIQSNQFKEIEFGKISKMMQAEENQASSEEIVFHALIGWINHKPTTRRGKLNKVFNLLKLDRLPLEFLHNVVAKESLIMNSSDCLRLCFLSCTSPERDESTKETKKRSIKKKKKETERMYRWSMVLAVLAITVSLIFVLMQGNRHGNVGMEDGRLPDGSITASSFVQGWKGRDWNNSPHCGRLNQQPVEGKHQGCWTASNRDPGEWIQVLLGTPTRVRGVVTQGCPSLYWVQFVKTYKIAYGNSEDNMQTIKDESGNDKIFQGNTDQNTEVTNMFPKPATARYFRLIVQTWNRWPSLRLEFLT